MSKRSLNTFANRFVQSSAPQFPIAFHTMNTKLFLILSIVLLCTATQGKFVAVGVQREALADNEFSFSFKDDGIDAVNVTGIDVKLLAPPRHRLLGMSDVDISLVHVVQQPEFVIPWHVHPRGSENYATISGILEISMTLELLTSSAPRKIVSKLPPTHASSIPQGLPHSVKCISIEPCVYHIFFNTADAGFAPASL